MSEIKLRHAERVRVLVQLVDGAATDLVAEYRNVRAELDAYPPGLGEKPRELVVSKVDIPEVRDRFNAQRPALADAADMEPLALSAATGEGVEQLLERLLALVPVEDGKPAGGKKAATGKRISGKKKAPVKKTAAKKASTGKKSATKKKVAAEKKVATQKKSR